MKRLFLIAIIVLSFGLSFQSCKIYSFTGANLSSSIKTYTVYYFPNRARLVNPTLSQVFTESLREKLEKQTSLNELTENGDLEFEGQITGYDIKPMSVQKQDMAASNRLTITINVKYSNNKEPDKNFEKSFNAYEDFDSSESLSAVEDDLCLKIIEKINDDIFNATIASW